MGTRLTHEVPQQLMQSGRGDPGGEHLTGSRGSKLNPFKFLFIDCGLTAKSLAVATHELPPRKRMSSLWDSGRCIACRRQPQGSAEEPWQRPSIPDFHIKREHWGRPREKERDAMGGLRRRGRRCQCAGALAWGNSWRWFVTRGCSMEEVSASGSALSLPGGFRGALYWTSALGVVAYIPYLQEGVPPASTVRWSPKHVLLTRMGGWG